MVVAGKNFKIDEATFNRLKRRWLSEPDVSAAVLGQSFGLTGDTVSRYMSEWPRSRPVAMTPKRKALKLIYGGLK